MTGRDEAVSTIEPRSPVSPGVLLATREMGHSVRDGTCRSKADLDAVRQAGASIRLRVIDGLGRTRPRGRQETIIAGTPAPRRAGNGTRAPSSRSGPRRGAAEAVPGATASAGQGDPGRPVRSVTLRAVGDATLPAALRRTPNDGAGAVLGDERAAVLGRRARRVGELRATRLAAVDDAVSVDVDGDGHVGSIPSSCSDPTLIRGWNNRPVPLVLLVPGQVSDGRRLRPSA